MLALIYVTNVLILLILYDYSNFTKKVGMKESGFLATMTNATALIQRLKIYDDIKKMYTLVFAIHVISANIMLP